MLIHQTFNSQDGYRYNAFIYENASWPAHFHKNLELVYMLEGQLEYTVNGRTAVLTPGDFALVLPNEVHSGAPLGACRCWIGVFSADHVHSFEKQVRGKMAESNVFRCEEAVRTLFVRTMINCTESTRQIRLSQPGVRGIRQEKPEILLTMACLYGVCSAFIRQVRLLPLPENSGGLRLAISEYIAQNYQNRISLAGLARHLGYNYHYLSKCFHRIFGQTFAQYLNACRMDAAQTLLTETDMDISQVALESGFQSIRSFNDNFKERMGMTPTQYRAGGSTACKE